MELLSRLQIHVPEAGLQIVNLMRSLNILRDRYLMEPPELFQLKFLCGQLRILGAHVEALKSELNWVVQGRPRDAVGCFPFLGSVLVREQPCPLMAFKGRGMEESFTVEVICGVLLDVRTGDTARVQMCLEGVAEETMDPSTAKMDPMRKQATFTHMKPLFSTRMGLAPLQWSVQVSVAGGPLQR